MEDFRTCSVCGAIIGQGDGHEVDDELFCEDCFNERFVICADCGRIIGQDVANYVHTDTYGYNHAYVCDDCLDDNYGFCDECQEYYPNDEMTTVSSGNYVCRSCRDDEYFCCPSCGEWYHTDYGYYNDGDNSYYCRECYEELEESGHDPRIRSYHDNPYVEFFGELINGRQHYMGYELEIDRRDFCRSDESGLIDELESIAGDRLYFMEDGSLNNGFEIISQPHTIEELNKCMGIDKILEACKSYGYSSHSIGTCGLHFHISRELFGPTKYRDAAIQKMMLFYDTFYDEVCKIARRTSGQLHWCNRYSGEDNNKLSNKAKAAKYKHFDEASYRHDDRYKVVNTTNNATVEIRIMRGTLKYESFMAAMDFVYTIANNARHISWNQATDASIWLKGIKPNTVVYLKEHNAFIDQLTYC